MVEIFIDGACKGNPGPAAVAFIIKKGETNIKEFVQDIGEATNNIAEYLALVYALGEALKLKEQQLKIYTDSELLFKQVTGSYKVKHPTIQLLFDLVKHLSAGFDRIEMKHIPRELNKEADKLASSIFKKEAKVVAPLFEISGEESPSSRG